MFSFPEGIYIDVRIEEINETDISYTQGDLDYIKSQQYAGAFIRAYNGQMWHYRSVDDISQIQNAINEMSIYSVDDFDMDRDSIVNKISSEVSTKLMFYNNNISRINIEEKVNLIKSYDSVISNMGCIDMWQSQYIDRRVMKSFYSNKGSHIMYDSQQAGFIIDISLYNNDNNFFDRYQKGSCSFSDLINCENEIVNFINRCIDYFKNCRDIESGKYTVVFAPIVSGVFAHEIFGHRSEADWLLESEKAKEQYKIGMKIATDILSIVDDGNILGSGYVPFDDEGTKAAKSYLIKNGVLTGRLHNVYTATCFNEDLTGNARALSFDFEPIVRMTTTYILPGDKTKEELIGDVEEGIYIESIGSGSAFSEFTLSPIRAYKIENGNVTYPVSVTMISGDIIETLNSIDGLSNEIQLFTLPGSGCDKAEQYPLPVGFGGPFVRILNMNIY